MVWALRRLQPSANRGRAKSSTRLVRSRQECPAGREARWRLIQRWKGDLSLGVDIHETPRTTGLVDEDDPVGLHARPVVAAHEGQVDG